MSRSPEATSFRRRRRFRPVTESDRKCGDRSGRPTAVRHRLWVETARPFPLASKAGVTHARKTIDRSQPTFDSIWGTHREELESNALGTALSNIFAGLQGCFYLLLFNRRCTAAGRLGHLARSDQWSDCARLRRIHRWRTARWQAPAWQAPAWQVSRCC